MVKLQVIFSLVTNYYDTLPSQRKTETPNICQQCQGLVVKLQVIFSLVTNYYDTLSSQNRKNGAKKYK